MRPHRSRALRFKREVKIDLSRHFDGCAILQRGPVEPLLDCVRRRFQEYGVTTNKFQVLNPSIFTDRGYEPDRSLDPLLPGHGRINRHDPLYRLRRLQVSSQSASQQELPSLVAPVGHSPPGY